MGTLVVQALLIAFGSIFVVDIIALILAKVQDRKRWFIWISAGISMLYAVVIFCMRGQNVPSQYDGVEVGFLIVIGMLIAMLVPMLVYEPITGSIKNPFLRIGSVIIIFILAALFMLSLLMPLI
ncbi:MAG: hypothetical protein WCJ45_06450 [bacterium]